jgi:hypothetical protein
MSPVTLLDLPVELRLRIAEYALEQHPAVGMPYTSLELRESGAGLRSAENLALLLVCRQFRSDFTSLAFSKTRFSVSSERQSTNLKRLPPHRLRSIRSIVHRECVAEIYSWGSYCYGLEQLHLDEFSFLCDDFFFALNKRVNAVTAFMRCLEHVKSVKFVMCGSRDKEKRSHYCKLIGAIMKEDHFQRYDALGAPNIETTWWDWELNPQADIITFTAQKPRSIFPEEEYMLLMKPKVDALMAEAERAAGL